MTIVFTIKDLGNEQNILERIRHAFYGDVGIVRCVKSYSRAVVDVGNTYILVYPSSVAFIEGLMFMESLVLDKVVEITEDVRIGVPLGWQECGDGNGVKYVLRVANVASVMVKEVKHQSFHIDFWGLVKAAKLVLLRHC